MTPIADKIQQALLREYASREIARKVHMLSTISDDGHPIPCCGVPKRNANPNVTTLLDRVTCRKCLVDMLHRAAHGVTEFPEPRP